MFNDLGTVSLHNIEGRTCLKGTGVGPGDDAWVRRAKPDVAREGEVLESSLALARLRLDGHGRRSRRLGIR